MTPIPPAVRGVLENLPRMKKCAIAGMFDECEGRLTKPEWHHVWIYASRQIQEPWAILAGCSKHHAAVQSDPKVRMAFEYKSLKLAGDEDLAEYPRKNWRQIKRQLGL